MMKQRERRAATKRSRSRLEKKNTTKNQSNNNNNNNNNLKAGRTAEKDRERGGDRKVHPSCREPQNCRDILRRPPHLPYLHPKHQETILCLFLLHLGSELHQVSLSIPHLNMFCSPVVTNSLIVNISSGFLTDLHETVSQNMSKALKFPLKV